MCPCLASCAPPARCEIMAMLPTRRPLLTSGFSANAACVLGCLVSWPRVAGAQSDAEQGSDGAHSEGVLGRKAAHRGAHDAVGFFRRVSSTAVSGPRGCTGNGVQRRGFVAPGGDNAAASIASPDACGRVADSLRRHSYDSDLAVFHQVLNGELPEALHHEEVQ